MEHECAHHAHETFWTLLQDKAHWQFEIFLMVLFDVVIGLILWPIITCIIWPKIKKACGCVVIHDSDSAKIKILEGQVAELMRERNK